MPVVGLHDLHILHEVDARLQRQLHVAPLYVERGILHNPEFAAESEILLVVRHELHVEAGVAVHLYRVHDVEAVELYGILADGTREARLQKSYLVVVDVDVGEHVFHHRAYQFARLQELVHSFRLLSLNDGLFRVWVLAVDMLAQRLVHEQRQNHLVVVYAALHLIEHPFRLRESLGLQVFRRDVVYRHGHLLVFVVLVEVVVGNVRALLRRNHSSH